MKNVNLKYFTSYKILVVSKKALYSTGTVDAEFSRTHEKLTVLQCSLTGIITTEKHIMLEWGRKWYEIWYTPNITGA